MNKVILAGSGTVVGAAGSNVVLRSVSAEANSVVSVTDGPYTSASASDVMVDIRNSSSPAENIPKSMEPVCVSSLTETATIS